MCGTTVFLTALTLSNGGRKRRTTYDAFHKVHDGSRRTNKRFTKRHQQCQFVEGGHQGFFMDHPNEEVWEVLLDTKQECCDFCAEYQECAAWTFEEEVWECEAQGYCTLFDMPLEPEKMLYLQTISGDDVSRKRRHRRHRRARAARNKQCQGVVGIVPGVPMNVDDPIEDVDQEECCSGCSQTEGCESWSWLSSEYWGVEMTLCAYHDTSLRTVECLNQVTFVSGNAVQCTPSYLLP